MDALLTQLRAAAEPTRLRLLTLLAHGELAVSELTQILGQSQPRVSRHLKLLCEAGLIDRYPEGAWVFHRLNANGQAGGLTRALLDMVPTDDQIVALDRQRLDAVRAQREEKAARYFRANAGNWDELGATLVDRDRVEQAMIQVVDGFGARDLVDMGTGTGHALTVLAGCAATATGFDQSREMLAAARANLERAGLSNCMVRLGDITQLPLPPDACDCAVIHQVMHYLTDPMPVIREAQRILRPGGHLLIADYAPHAEEWLRDQHAHRRLGFPDGEVHDWFHAVGLNPQQTLHIAGPRLTVALWTAVKLPHA